MSALAVSLIVLLFSFYSSTANEYYVASFGGESCPLNSNVPCNSLSFYTNQSTKYFTNDTVFYFLEGTHILEQKELVTISGVSNLTLIGLGDMRPGFHSTVMVSTVQIMCPNDSLSGFVFESSENITISGITIAECGGLGNTRGFFSSSVYLTLAFDFVSNVILEQVSVLNGTGIGLLVRNTYMISIRDSSFSRNEIPNSCEYLCPGGNLEMRYFDDANADSNETEISIEVEILRSNFSFGYSTEYGMNSGIGISVSFERFVNINVVMERLVVYGNTAILSPNLQIELTCSAGIAYSISIANTVSTYGNGIRKPPQSILDILQVNTGGLYFIDQSRGHTESRFAISNSEFSNGDVYNYGGLQLVWLTGDISNILMASIENCTIRNNTGDGGMGMYIFASRNLESLLPHMSIKNVTIDSNMYSNDRDPLYGAILIQNFNLSIAQLVISNNSATGIVSLASVLTFTGPDNIFQNNTGQNGGGLALHESSFIVLRPPTHIAFLDNFAYDRGGGIFVGQTQYASIIKASCFYQLPDDVQGRDYIGTVRVFFSGNSANNSGNVLYGGNIENCFSSVTFDNVFNYTLQTGNSVISSDATGLCYCSNDRPVCTQGRYSISVAPGERFTIPVAIVGQRNGITSGVLQLTDYTFSPPTITPRALTSNCNNVNYVTKLINNRQSSALVYLTLEGTRNPVNSTESKLLRINVYPCPAGFSFDARLGSCQCDAILLGVNDVECNVTTQEMTRAGSVWMGYNNVSRCTYVREDCPFRYCISNEVTFQILDPNPQCSLNRSGIMCGACAEGLSLLLGSDRCDECSNLYLLLIIVYALAGFFVVALLIALNLTVSVGTINGLIFYVNIIKINEEIFFPNGPLPVLNQFISWINLESGIESCFFDGMTALHKTWLHFVFPVYLWSIVIVLIIMAHYSMKVAKLLGNNAVSVLSTLLLLAYSEVFRGSINALNGTYLSCDNETTTVWYIDPNISYYDGGHIALVIVSCIFLFFIALPYTLLLLFIRPFSLALNSDRCHSCGCHGQRLGIRLFFSAYNNPFKPQFTFWTGLLLLVRFVIVFVVAFSPNTNHAAATVSLVAILLTIQAASGGIYEKRALDILEAWFLFNLLLVAAFSKVSDYVTMIVTSTSITLCLITAIGIIAFHIALRFKNNKLLKSLIMIAECYIEGIRENRKDIPNDDEANQPRERHVSTTSIELLRRETLLTEDDHMLAIRAHKSNN